MLCIVIIAIAVVMICVVVMITTAMMMMMVVVMNLMIFNFHFCVLKTRIVGGVTLVLFLLLAIAGMDWVTR